MNRLVRCGMNDPYSQSAHEYVQPAPIGARPAALLSVSLGVQWRLAVGVVAGAGPGCAVLRTGCTIVIDPEQVFPRSV